MSKKNILETVAIIVCGLALNTGLQRAGAEDSMPGMKMTGDSPDASASTQAFHQADKTMMDGMMGAPYTGNTDRDLVTHMIPHHEGAVAMAKVELKYGKDAKIRKLARQIIGAQEKEIAMMKQWLTDHPEKK